LKLQITKKLVLIFLLALISLLFLEFVFTKHNERKDISEMKNAVALTKYWFNCVEQMKKEKGIFNDAKSAVLYSALIGDEFTDITTTLGSLEAKQISTNPEFAALIRKYLSDCDVDSTKTVGLIISGSFPALAISSLAAMQTINSKAIIFSSLGASMYGANQPGATWLDIENYLYKNGGLKYRSNLISLGAENDTGGGLTEEGIQKLKSTVLYYDIKIFEPNSLEESIQTKLEILKSKKVDVLINVGGNQTSLGRCVHSVNIPNGLQKKFISCKDYDRGIIAHISENGIPFVNLLNIKKLAIENDISFNASSNTESSIYWEQDIDKIPVAFSLILLSVLILSSRKKNQL
jgi:poly-gamma-glutamate system protein